MTDSEDYGFDPRFKKGELVVLNPLPDVHMASKNFVHLTGLLATITYISPTGLRPYLCDFGDPSIREWFDEDELRLVDREAMPLLLTKDA